MASTPTTSFRFDDATLAILKRLQNTIRDPLGERLPAVAVVKLALRELASRRLAGAKNPNPTNEE